MLSNVCASTSLSIVRREVTEARESRLGLPPMKGSKVEEGEGESGSGAIDGGGSAMSILISCRCLGSLGCLVLGRDVRHASSISTTIRPDNADHEVDAVWNVRG